MFDLDNAIDVLRRAAPDRVGAPIVINDPRPATYEKPSAIKNLAPPAAALLTRDLYSHQVRAIQAGVDGHNLVISTDTASGKSLCFQALAAHILAEGDGTILYLAPINALLMDQLDAFEHFFTSTTPAVRSHGSIEAYSRRLKLGEKTFLLARYDGTVPKEGDVRRTIRTGKPRLLLATPEMLVRAILPFSSDNKGPDDGFRGDTQAWRYLFAGLRLIILDELHAFRGVFGAHVANVLRRAKRMVHLCGGDVEGVQFVACSATIKDPIGTAELVTGARDFVLVDRSHDTSPRNRRVLVPITSAGEKMSTFAARLLPAIAAEAGARTIAFRDHIPQLGALNVLLDKNPKLNGRVEAYCASATADVKPKRIRELRAGHIQCLLSTSALELGIDIGELDASVLLGYPGSIARAWQMLGRAGRRGDGLLVYVAGPGYLDEYWHAHAHELIGKDAAPEDVVLDPDNPEIVREHVRAAALDHVLEPERDSAFFGAAFAEVFDELRSGADDGVFLEDEVWVIREPGQQKVWELSLRGLGQFKVPAYEGSYSPEAKPICEEDSYRALRTFFPGSVFVFDRGYFRCEKLVYPSKQGKFAKGAKAYAIVQRQERPEYLTTARVREDTQILERLSPPDRHTGWGKVEVTNVVEGYFRNAEAVRELEGAEASKAKSFYVAFEDESRPPDRKFRTHGAWFQLPSGLADQALDEADRATGLATAAEALARAVPLLRFAGLGDVSAAVRENVEGFEQPDPVIHINETVIGGAGIARRAWEKRAELVRTAMRLMVDCPQCSARRAKSNGCPRCVALEDGSQNRGAAIRLLDAWSRTMEPGRAAAAVSAPKNKRAADRRTIMATLQALGFTNVEPRPSREGGQGQVWRARRDKCDVAVKLVLHGGPGIPPGDSAEAWEERLQREGERIRELQHPNIVRLLGVHHAEVGVALEFEWVNGQEISDYLESAPPEEARADLWRTIVAAVAHMHAREIVHRDLKPGNILVRGNGSPVIIDFGIARSLATERATTAAFGTPGWCPPEQMKDGARVAPTMDVYALGQLLWFLMTGGLRSDTNGQIRLPDPTLASALERCLEPKPKRRFPDAQALLAAINPRESRKGQ